jgi:hypothetical protein
MPVTRTPVRTSPRPEATTSRANDSHTTPKSIDPVVGECRPAMPTTCGSSAAIPAASSRSSPGTPLARARASRSSSRPSSEVSVATMTFPSSVRGMPVASAYASSAALPSRHSRAFADPGA